MPTAVIPESSSQSSVAGKPDLSAPSLVLSHLLDQHPRRLTVKELAGEINPGLAATAVRRAVDNLAAARLLHLEGGKCAPDPAVLDFDRGRAGTPS
jgi:hypothetical protein